MSVYGPLDNGQNRLDDGRMSPNRQLKGSSLYTEVRSRNGHQHVKTSFTSSENLRLSCRHWQWYVRRCYCDLHHGRRWWHCYALQLPTGHELRSRRMSCHNINIRRQADSDGTQDRNYLARLNPSRIGFGHGMGLRHFIRLNGCSIHDWKGSKSFGITGG